jgi:prepilin-type processing-associated H-X9-DG protein
MSNMDQVRTTLDKGLNQTSIWTQNLQHEEDRQRQRWASFIKLPWINRALLWMAAGLGTLGILGVILPPAFQGIATAAHPYTAAGKQEVCLVNLQVLRSALAMYAKDYDEKFPPLEYRGRERITWVTLTSAHAAAGDFECPLDPIPSYQFRTISSYGYNPVLASEPGNTVGAADVANPAGTILLADRSDFHDLALLPPFPSWRSDEGVLHPANLDFRHSDRVGLLFVDGHADARTSGEWTNQIGTWGDSLVRQRATARILRQSPLFVRLEKAVARGDHAAVMKLLRSQRKSIEFGFQQVLPLWKDIDLEARDQWLARWGWHLDRTVSGSKTSSSPTVVSGLPYVDIYPFDRLLKPAELAGKSAEQLRLIRNAIYARHGRPFRDAKLQRFFDHQPWYHKDNTWHIPQDDGRRLTDVERSNVFLTQGKAYVME